MKSKIAALKGSDLDKAVASMPNPITTGRMTVMVNTLSGPALDWAVSVAEHVVEHGNTDGRLMASYSSDWGVSGDILEREKIAVEPLKEGDGWCATFGCTPHDFLMWDQQYQADAVYAEGATALEAALRCFVVAKLGESLEIDEMLAQQLNIEPSNQAMPKRRM